MLNKYDFKYILKRVIVFFIIGLIMSLIGSFKVRAYSMVETAPIGNTNNLYNYKDILPGSSATSINLPNVIFRNYGKGNINFTITYGANSSNNTSRNIVEVRAIGTGNGIWNCDIGNYYNYFDSNKQLQTATINCPVNLDNQGVEAFYILLNAYDANGQGMVVYYSTYATFTRDGFDSTAIINALNTLDAHNMQYLTYVIDNSNTNWTNALNRMQQIYIALDQGNLTLANILLKLDEIENSSKAVEDAINSDNIDNNAVTDNTQGWEQQTSYVPTGSSGGSITDLLTLPIKLIQGFVNGLNSSCVPFNLGNLYGTDLILPCINISSFIGLPLWTTIDILFSGFMILHIGKKFVKIFNDFTNLRSGQMDDLYGGGN